MFFAHLFAGYLVSRKVKDNHKDKQLVLRYILFGLFCSVMPDLDLIYFYIWDHRQHIHHSYWTHIPLFWIACCSALYLFSKLLKKNLNPYILLIFLNTLLHLFLDSVVGGIYWFYPVTDDYLRMFTLTSRYNWWVLNYIIHWTFLFELAIIATAIYMLRVDFSPKPNRTEKRILLLEASEQDQA